MFTCLVDVGAGVGADVFVGADVGADVGAWLGTKEGANVGAKEGARLGEVVGTGVGAKVHCSSTHCAHCSLLSFNESLQHASHVQSPATAAGSQIR